ncbi:hypothetical protein HETIRDRAFT_99794 [Heterobasidion irregulare TC 32-1]|uniref:Uncharacterized protein n=1 Tax=Heterobasidion irregulare (strain TC 32-1) TaxID=747525 RepID=W4KQW2_HETIT|nr:uncharacterized protein HETIRDRAFT_99794 [Heterobasidion irregulare TC 32-1]ETW87446.1 hypothetical protein HETIRDRAFT_99794 [Heterobasidion irregulare TC 32-1]
MAANRLDGEQLTERTALLSERRTVSPSQSEYPHAVLPIVNLVRSQGLHILDEHYAVFPTLPTLVEQTSFRLVVLLQLYLLSQKTNFASRDIWDRWSKERDANLAEAVKKLKTAYGRAFLLKTAKRKL